MIKWQVVVALPDNLNLEEAVKIKQAIEKSSGLPSSLKIERVASGEATKVIDNLRGMIEKAKQIHLGLQD